MQIIAYGAPITEAIVSGDLGKMKAAKKLAEDYIAKHGDLPTLLTQLKIEIAKLESK